VAAEIKITTDESLSEFKIRLRKHCANLMPAFKVPTKITLIEGYTHNARFKRMRKRTA
jgi:long-chain acyl-CoA synthetase